MEYLVECSLKHKSPSKKLNNEKNCIDEVDQERALSKVEQDIRTDSKSISEDQGSKIKDDKSENSAIAEPTTSDKENDQKDKLISDEQGVETNQVVCDDSHGDSAESDNQEQGAILKSAA